MLYIRHLNFCLIQIDSGEPNHSIEPPAEEERLNEPDEERPKERTNEPTMEDAAPIEPSVPIAGDDPSDKPEFPPQDADAERDEPQSPGQENVVSNLAPLVVRIDFALVNPHTGLHFALPDPVKFPYRWPHAHSSDLRSIFPCLDSLKDRGTWELEFIVPRMLERFDGAGFESHETVVVCSGEVVEQVLHPTDCFRKIVYCRLDVPTVTRSVAFAVGPFDLIPLDLYPDSAVDDAVANGNRSEPEAAGSISDAVYVLPTKAAEVGSTFTFLGQVESLLREAWRWMLIPLPPGNDVLQRLPDFLVSFFLFQSCRRGQHSRPNESRGNNRNIGEPLDCPAERHRANV